MGRCIPAFSQVKLENNVVKTKPFIGKFFPYLVDLCHLYNSVHTPKRRYPQPLSKNALMLSMTGSPRKKPRFFRHSVCFGKSNRALSIPWSVIKFNIARTSPSVKKSPHSSSSITNISPSNRPAILPRYSAPSCARNSILSEFSLFCKISIIPLTSFRSPRGECAVLLW